MAPPTWPIYPIFLFAHPLDHTVGWFLRGTYNFCGRPRSRCGQFLRINQSHLSKHRSLVPINVLAGDFSIFELDNHDNGNFDSFTRGPYTGRNPWHLDRVCKLVN